MTDPPRYLLFGGELVPYADANLHVLTTTLKYGVGVFEGLRAYWNEEHAELYAFRLEDHFQRLIDSLRLASIDVPPDSSRFAADLIALIRANEFRQSLHMRVQVFVNSPDGPPDASGPALVCMAAMPMNGYFAQSSLDLCVSSWTRISDRSMPPRIKAIANYQNSRLAMLEAKTNGYTGTLLLTSDGHVSEGPGYNVFLVRDGRLVTPRVTDAILEGVTRDSVIKLAGANLGLTVEERSIDRTELYLADEVFVCGSAAEVTAVSSIDRRVIGDGHPGPVTTSLQAEYRAATHNTLDDDFGWVSPVYGEVAADRSGEVSQGLGKLSDVRA